MTKTICIMRPYWVGVIGVYFVGTWAVIAAPPEGTDLKRSAPLLSPPKDADQVKPDRSVDRLDETITMGEADGAAEPALHDPLPAFVIEVGGRVDWALAGTSVLGKEGWTAVQLNDRIDPGSQIRTGLRSHVNLKFGETTVVSVRSATHASVEQFYRSANVEHVRMGLGYGTVRGGSTEGEIRADVLIDSTVATLAKRGTEGWQMSVEPATGRFHISLAEHGLVEAIRKVRDEKRISKTVRPGEYATEANIANLWIQEDIFNRSVKFFQADAVTTSDAEFNMENSRGYAIIAPGGGSNLVAATNRGSAAFVLDELAARNPRVNPPNLAILEPGPIERPEGNFGTGGIFGAGRRARVPR